MIATIKPQHRTISAQSMSLQTYVRSKAFTETNINKMLSGKTCVPIITTLMMGTEIVPETSAIFQQTDTAK
jgi:hypothetical protein